MGNRPVTAALTAMFVLSACGSGGSRNEAVSTTTAPIVTSTTTPDPNALILGQRSTTKEGNVVEVVRFQQPLPSGVLEPEPGMEFAAAEVAICAGPSGARRVTPEAIQIEMPDGSRRGRSFFGPKEPALAEARLAGGGCVRGWVNFEVPEGERPAYVVFNGSSIVRWTAGGRSRSPR